MRYSHTAAMADEQDRRAAQDRIDDIRRVDETYPQPAPGEVDAAAADAETHQILSQLPDPTVPSIRQTAIDEMARDSATEYQQVMAAHAARIAARHQRL